MQLSNTYALSNLTSSAFTVGEAVRAKPASFRVGTQRIVSAASAYQPARFAPVKHSRYVKPMVSR
jgi:epoxyqueuosine reductase QueG